MRVLQKLFASAIPLVAVTSLASPAFANDTPTPQPSVVTCEQRYASEALTSLQMFQNQVRLAPDLRSIAQTGLVRNLKDAQANFTGCLAVVIGSA